MGAPSRLTEARAAQIVAAIRTGANVSTAARGCGLAPATLYDWLRHGRTRPRTAYAALTRAVEQARAAARRNQQAAIEQAARTEAGDRRRGFRVVRRGAEHPVEA